MNEITTTSANHYEYRSTVFTTKTPAQRFAAFAKQSPYFIIALAFNTTLLAVATIWKLNDERQNRLAPTMLTSASVLQTDAEAPAAAEERRDIFSGQDAELPSDFDPSEAITPDEPMINIIDPTFKESDHYESDDGEDFHTFKGSDAHANIISSIIASPNSGSIGVGSGSVRGGGGGFGYFGGGREKLKKRYNKSSHASQYTETAVEAGLRWLARHQDEDGSWSPEGFTKNCQGGTICEHGKGVGSDENRVGSTGLALLAFLGAGYDHRATKWWTDPFTKKAIRVGDVVKKGLIYLKDQQQESGSLVDSTNTKWGYNHSIAALALSEAFGLSRAPQWKGAAQRAIDHLISGQNSSPGGTGLWGWRYRPNCGDNDISVTGWAVMALKSAEMAGLRISQDSLNGAYQFCDEITDKTSGQVGYTRREEAGSKVMAIGKNEDYQNHPGLAAVGMCVRAFVKHNIDDPMLEAAAKWIVKDLPKWDKAKKSNDYYYWYYATLALNQFDGPDSPRAGKGNYWREWEAALKKALIDNQTNNASLCSDGSWDGDDRWGVDGGGRVYATAINTLNFEVYYRYGNSFGTAKKLADPPKPKK